MRIDKNLISISKLDGSQRSVGAFQNENDLHVNDVKLLSFKSYERYLSKIYNYYIVFEIIITSHNIAYIWIYRLWCGEIVVFTKIEEMFLVIKGGVIIYKSRQL